jgi:hypothetical protein
VQAVQSGCEVQLEKRVPQELQELLAQKAILVISVELEQLVFKVFRELRLLWAELVLLVPMAQLVKLEQPGPKAPLVWDLQEQQEVKVLLDLQVPKVLLVFLEYLQVKAVQVLLA